MMSILIIGAGGYGRLVKEIAELNKFEQIDFLDDNSDVAVGKIEALELLQDKYDGSIVAIGNPEIRENINDRCKRLLTLVHPSAIISPSATIGKGCIIEANTVISSEAEIKEGSIICAGAVINHNARVGKYCQIDCNAVVAVGETVPEKTKVDSCSVYKRVSAARAVNNTDSFF